ncbi:MAG: histidine phosphatase family protein [Enterobacteriaceae bacterium]
MKKWIVTLLTLSSVIATPALAQKNSTDEQKPSVELYLVRHGKTMLNTTDRVQGWSDAVLTPEGKKVVEYLGKGLRGLPFTAIYSSDSGRALETARIIQAESGLNQLTIQPDWHFREFNFGSYEGDLNPTMWGDLAKAQGITLEQWKDTVTPKEFANGVAKLDKERSKQLKIESWPAEDYADVTKRVRIGLEKLIQDVEKQGGGNVLLVSHGLTMGAMIDILVPDYKESHRMKNASVTHIQCQQMQCKILDINDMKYVEAGKKL